MVDALCVAFELTSIKVYVSEIPSAVTLCLVVEVR
jgi:hypothetical protein